jgi:FkbM family methyltransferase
MENISRFDKIRIKFRRTPVIKSISRFSSYKGLIKNWWEYYLVKVGLRAKADIIFRKDNKLFTLSRQNQGEFYKEFAYRRLEYYGAKIKKDKNSFLISFKGFLFKVRELDIASIIVENFIEEPYKWLKSRGETVVDVGANIGDTAIYFGGLENASKVIAVEPVTYAYNSAKENIRLNKLDKKIILLNGAVDKKKGHIYIANREKSTGILNKKRQGKRVRVFTLDELIKKYKINDALLKLDCEGYEYPIILSAKTATLRKFKRIVLECHWGYLNIEKRLKSAGFKVKHTSPAYNEYADIPDMVINLVFAKRI